LVIFIDDLDRCSEKQTVDLLEAIKLYLQARNCVFVLGMDPTAVRRALTNVLPGCTAETATEYIEKLVQATVRVPIPDSTTSFVTKLLAETKLPPTCQPTLCQLLEPNPRKIKNFINSLAVWWKPHVNETFAILIHYLRMYHTDVFRLLSYDAAHAHQFTRVMNEGLIKLPAQMDPVYLLFYRAFRHVASELPEKDRDAIVDEMTRRIDQHRGDRAFVSMWRASTSTMAEDALVTLLGPAIRDTR